MPRKAVKKTVPAKTTPKLKNLNWHDKGNWLLEEYLKRTKTPRACLVALSSFGDLILKAGKVDHLDWTSLGSIFSAVQGASESLNKLLSARTSFVHFGEAKDGIWLEWAPGHCLLVGIGVPFKSNDLKLIRKHLKSGSPLTAGKQGMEALDGMTLATLNEAIGKEI